MKEKSSVLALNTPSPPPSVPGGLRWRARGPCQMTTNLATITPRRWTSSRCRVNLSFLHHTKQLKRSADLRLGRGTWASAIIFVKLRILPQAPLAF